MIKNMNKLLLESDFNKGSLSLFDVEGTMVSFLEQPVIRRRNVNFTFWHRGLLTGHEVFKFNGVGSVPLKTEEEFNLFINTVKQYTDIMLILEKYIWEYVDFNEFSKLSTYDAREGFNDNYVEVFKQEIVKDDIQAELSKFDKKLVDLIIDNIISENKTMRRIYSKWFKD